MNLPLPSDCPIRKRGLELREVCKTCSGFPGTGQMRVKRGDRLVTEGQAADSLHLVVSGLLRETRTTEDGREIDTRLVKPGSVIGIESLDPGATWQCSVVALSRGRVCKVPVDQARQRLDHDPKSAWSLIGILRQDIVTLREQLRRVTMRSAVDRVASLLDELLADVPNGTWYELPLGRLEMGALAGLDRATVSRALHRLAKSGRFELQGRRIRRPSP